MRKLGNAERFSREISQFEVIHTEAYGRSTEN